MQIREDPRHPPNPRSIFYGRKVTLPQVKTETDSFNPSVTARTPWRTAARSHYTAATFLSPM